jgi:RNA polymerase sigma-70 factor, ECF subfamily
VLQAAIASLYAEAPSYDLTDWPQIVAIYDQLLKVWPSPVVELNRAVPLAMVAGPRVALAEVERLERGGQLAGYQYLPAIKADLLGRLGRTGEAAKAYRQAIALAANETERAFLTARVKEHQLSRTDRGSCGRLRSVSSGCVRSRAGACGPGTLRRGPDSRRPQLL